MNQSLWQKVFSHVSTSSSLTSTTHALPDSTPKNRLWTRRLPLTGTAVVALLAGTTACGRGANQAADVVQAVSTSYNAGQHRLIVQAKPVPANQTGENVVDLNSTVGLSNYAASKVPGGKVQQVEVRTPSGTRMFSVTNVDNFADQNQPATSPGAMVYQRAPIPGVTMDPYIRPVAPVNAWVGAKQAAIMRIARSKLGTPYIWGHNEDRGQYGFDCSNYTAYVYHHALGYRMSGSSLYQYYHVGRPIPRYRMQVGDLVIFEYGKHVGIYAGNQTVIQEGGGLGRCGYLSIGPRSYWGKHITTVKQMW